MTEKVHRYIVAYDVASDARRARVAKTLESYGDRLQYSVFLVDVKPAKLVRLKVRVRAHIEPVTDSVLICDLGPLAGARSGRVEFIGANRPFTGHDPIIL